MYVFEKKGGLPRDEGRMELFRRTLEVCQLVDVGFFSTWFTSEGGNLSETNIQELLDRGVATIDWISLFLEVKVQHLVHSFSDHCLLLINTKMGKDRLRSNTFKLEAWWVLEDIFFKEVKRLWGLSSGRLLQKLDNLKKGLSQWARKIQMNRRRRRQALTDKLAELMANDRDEECMVEMINTRIHLNLEIEKDERYWE
ncbi:uncharacterized protein LOC108488122 [Gossypium arboreum]|nr:uncharacterized protein LOC108488122 [Gossypium arboreum]